MKEQLYIIKIGGNCINDTSVLIPFLMKFSEIQGKKILIHGGGSIATKHAQLLNIQQHFHEGRRITDKQTLDIAVMSYRGLINAEITSLLQSMQCNAIGICGADAGLITAEKRIVNDIDYGFVGDINANSINIDMFNHLLEFPLTPVIAPITFDRSGNLFNTNADTIATMIAIALQKTYDVTLIYCFDKNGVLSDPSDHNSVIESLHRSEYEILQSQGMIQHGMIPKLDNAFHALDSGVNTIFLTSPDSLQSDRTVTKGTRIVS
ncbi:MAG: acetylglutamate kinase [Bacteroidota bacterium]|jgi:acetylglutamate kinase